MKKTAILVLAALALAACQREVNDPQASTAATYTVTITASLSGTRTAYDEDGKFTWVAGDQIHVLISDGTAKKQVAFTTAEAGPEVQFTGEVDEGFQVTSEAAFALDFDASESAWIIPESVTVDPEKPLSSLPLFGEADASKLYQFKTATGILKFTVENVPVETASVTLETVGEDAPALSGKLAAAPANGIVTMAALAGGKKLVSTCAPADINTTRDYYFFVPAGTLPADKTVFSVVDGSDNVIKSFQFKKPVEVAANRITNVAPVHFKTVKITNRQTDSLALVALYDASKGAEWAKNQWDLAKPMDEWKAVTLTGGRVTALKLTTSGVITKEWTLPTEIGDLAELTDLRINSNKLTGELPETLFELTKLQKLYFQNDDLTGELSASLSNLTDLTELYLDRNKNLGGTLPEDIGKLTGLTGINISQTAIGGPIPQSLSQCTSLKSLMANSCQLSGEIPDFWDQLPNIGTLQMYGNPGLTGPIPASMGTLKAATGIQLKECNLTGNIPASFGGLVKCSTLLLNGNKLSGVVPAEVQAHSKWQATSGWKYETNILPQQEGYGLTLE